MDDQNDLSRNKKAQALIEWILLVIIIVFAASMFAIAPTAPFKSVYNSILYDPVNMIHSGSDQIQFNTTP